MVHGSLNYSSLKAILPSGRFTWSFTLAEVSQPILGTDFLQANSLLVDMTRKRLVNAESFTSISLSQTNVSAMTLNPISLYRDKYAMVLADFPLITIPQFSQVLPKHKVQHHIPTSGPLISSQARQLSPEKLTLAKQEFQKMLEMGTIHQSSSPWASPLHLVPKASGGWRSCRDYRRLNAATLPDRYSIPHTQDFSARLAGATIFSKIDLIRGYHQVPVTDSNISKTAVITPFGLFEFLCMPFGLKNAAQAFQRLMDSVCQSLDFVFVYLDNILVVSTLSQAHLSHLKQLFQPLSEHGLVINLSKCEFGRLHLVFLGNCIDKIGACPLPDKRDAIQTFPRPSTN